MKVLKSLFLMSILGIAINSFSQNTNKIERSPHLTKNENIFLEKISVKLQQLSERIYSSGAIDVNQYQGTTEQDLLIALDLNANISFKFRDVKESRLSKNAKFIRYTQYYKGIKIEGAGFTAKYENNDLTYFKPIIHQNINLNPIPQIAVSQLNGILQTNKVFSQELLITDEFQSQYRLFWKVNYMNQGNKISYVDAATGEIVKTKSGLIYKNAPTEDFGVQNMNDNNIGNVTSLRSVDDRVRTFNFNLANLYDIGIVDFSDNLIPTSPSNTIWGINHAPSNVYQAHWAVSNCVNEFDQLGIYFEQVNVGSNLDNVYNGQQSPNAAAFFASFPAFFTQASKALSASALQVATLGSTLATSAFFSTTVSTPFFAASVFTACLLHAAKLIASISVRARIENFFM